MRVESLQEAEDRNGGLCDTRGHGEEQGRNGGGAGGKRISSDPVVFEEIGDGTRDGISQGEACREGDEHARA